MQLQSVKRKIIIPRDKIEIRQGDQYVRFEPFTDVSDEELIANPRLEFNCSIDFTNSRAIGQQEISVNFSHRSFMDLCEARTFCHIKLTLRSIPSTYG